MSDFTARFERLELKFLIDEVQAERIRSDIAPYCNADKHSRAQSTSRPSRKGYPISSLYLDTPSLAFHRAKERGDPERIKLRVRTYSDTSPATLEIKRRRSDVIDKTRGSVDRHRVEDAARGAFHPPGSPRFLDDFAAMVATAGALPTLTVRYEREAYESTVDEYARVTFDRHITVRPNCEWELCPDSEDWCHFDEHWKTGLRTLPVVMEVKCQTDSLPIWMIDMVRRNDLSQTSFSKYSIGVHLTQQRNGHDGTRSRAARCLG